MAPEPALGGYAKLAGAWESLVEVSPLLGQCRLLLRQPGACLDHRALTVRIALDATGLLQLVLEGRGLHTGQETLVLQLGCGVTARSDCLKLHEDHLCVSLHVDPDSKWLSQLMTPWGQDLPEQDSLEVVCRGCQSQVLRERRLEEPQLEAFLLPTSLWQTCAEVVACEECSPMGQGHIRAVPGRLYVSAQCFLICAGDLDEAAVLRDADALVRCRRCGLAIGEWEPPSRGRESSTSERRRKRLFCGESWRLGSACQAAGITLYKHRISLPTRNDSAMPHDLLEEYSEVSSVGAHLLSLRTTQGQSRFMLMPSHPTAFGDLSEEWTDESPSAEALEVRIVVPSLLLLGPHFHAGSKPTTSQAQRAAKVYFRRCTSTEASAPGRTQVVIPLKAMAAVCSSLDAWIQRLPPSQAQAAVGRTWHTSYLELPPQEATGD